MTLTYVFTSLELLLVVMSYIAASIEFSLGSWMKVHNLVGIYIGLTSWLMAVSFTLTGLKNRKPIWLLFYVVFKILINYGCMILFLSMLILITNPMYITPAITFHGKLEAKYAPFLLPLSAGIGIYNCFAVVGWYKCFKFLSDERNYVKVNTEDVTESNDIDIECEEF